MSVAHCAVCRKMPHEIEEYVECSKGYANMTPAEYVKREEGTYNSSSGRFYCTACYISADLPNGKAP